jgi:diaminobutyrate-2-oxoglutarate transaminase
MDREELFEEMSLPGAPRIVSVPPGPRSREILEFQAAHESSVVSYSRGMPMALARGRGATMEDVDGNLYIDMFAGAGVMSLGHGHPVALQAAHEQLDRVTHALDIPSETRQHMVEALHRVLPPELTRVFFGGPTGSDAVEQAVKLAKWNTKRFGIIAFEGAYHGMTAGALSLTSDAGHKDGLGPLVPGVQFIPFPYHYRNPFGCPDEVLDRKAAENLARVLDDSHSGYSKPAAVIVEPVQGEGGTLAPGPEFLQLVRKITSERDVLLICDEVQAGFGRTGRMFAFEHAGIVPDIMVMSKALGGIGLPISAIAYREQLNTWPPALTIGTFRGNLVAYAAGAAAINWMVDHEIPARAARLGAQALLRMKAIEARHEIVGEARGIGLMLAMEIVEDKTSKRPASVVAKTIRKVAHQRGVMIEIGGHHNNVVRLLPPLVIPERLLMRGLDILEEVIASVEAETGPRRAEAVAAR